MIIYIDLLLIINFSFDFLLLIIVDLILKRNCRLIRIFLGALLGALSILLIFVKISNFILFIYKIIISFIMIIISFKYKNIKYTLTNMLYLYTSSIILGGFLYYLNNEFSLEKKGMFFVNNGLSINYILIIILAPLILYIYYKQNKKSKSLYSNYYKCIITLSDNSKIEMISFLDSGNHLTDPITNKKIVLINKNAIKNKKLFERSFFVPYKVLNHHSLLKCIKAKELWVEGFGNKKNILLGIIENDLDIVGADAILNYEIMEELKCLRN